MSTKIVVGAVGLAIGATFVTGLMVARDNLNPPFISTSRLAYEVGPYQEALELLVADLDRNGELSQPEAEEKITDKFTDDKGYITAEQVERAKDFGNKASQYTPNHGRVFLSTLDAMVTRQLAEYSK